MREEKPKYLDKESFNTIYKQVPRACVELVIDDVGGVLLTKRAIDPGKGFWHLPGGTILLGESFEDAAIRIALEETNLDIDELELLSVIEYHDEENPFYHSIGIIFYVGAFEGEIKTNDQATDIDFFSTLPEPLVEEHKSFLEEFLSEDK